MILMVALTAIGGGLKTLAASELTTTSGAASTRFPTIHPEHKHVRALMENALRYVAPESRTIDPASGYPVEGWNHDPANAFCLRSFTQLTAIGQWMEVLANIIVGHVETPYYSREQALTQLDLVVKSLRHDQKDPEVSAKGLLGNFLDLAGDKRQGLLACDVEKEQFLKPFGAAQGESLWQALKAKGWILPLANDREASIRRGVNYGWNYFDGPLASYADDATKRKVMAILDHRVVMVVFGDNANLTTSVAKTIGSLLHPEVRDNPKVEQLRREMEKFLDDQKEGYAYLYDAKAGLFSFGWDASKDRLFGWADEQGNWQAGYMDYLVNEFRGPTKFVVLRYGLPVNAIRNLGFKMKPYRTKDGADLYALAPWEGSAFQALGLGLSMAELNDSSWRKLLENVVDIEIDYSVRKQLPGFLSESYTGHGATYTGDVGIPDIAVSTMPRITDAASLYTLGVAYMIAPAKIEQFLAVNWPVVSKLLTDHGPWEGYNVAKQEVIQVQTTAHTLSLVLGLLGTGSEHMVRYLDAKGLTPRLAELYKPGVKLDLLGPETQAFAWTNDGGDLTSSRDKTTFHVKGERLHRVGMAFVPATPSGVSFSGGLLTIRYRSTKPIEQAVISLKPAGSGKADVGLISKELYARFDDTKGREQEIQIPLPALPGLTGIKEVVITYGQQAEARPVDLTITHFAFTPYSEPFQTTAMASLFH